MHRGPDRVKFIFRGLRAAAVTIMLGLGSSSIAFCGPIHVATVKGDEATVVALLSKIPIWLPAETNSVTPHCTWPRCITRWQSRTCSSANGADVNARNERYGETPLTLALQSYQHKEMLELLLTHGADANVMLPYGDTPLHSAVERDLPYDVELLLANGADPNAKGFNWQSPVHAAVLHGRTHILELLLDYGADPNAKDLGGHTPLYYAESDSYERLWPYFGHTVDTCNALFLRGQSIHIHLNPVISRVPLYLANFYTIQYFTKITKMCIL